MSSIAMSAAHFGRCYRRAAKRVAVHPAAMVIFDQLVIRSQIQLGAHPSQLDEFDSRSVVLPARLAGQLDMLAGPQMAPIRLAGVADQGSKPTLFATRSSSVG